MKKKYLIVLAISLLSLPAILFANWTTPSLVSELSSDEIDYTPFLSFDGSTLYFARKSEGYKIWQATWDANNDLYVNIQPVSEINTFAKDASYPWVSPDNLRLYFHSYGSVYMSERQSPESSWISPIAITELNNLGSINAARLTPDELAVVFCSNSNILNHRGDYDIYIATRPDKNSPFGNIQNLGELNTSGIEAHPFITPDMLTLYFISDRDSEYEKNRIYKATRSSINDPFANIQHMAVFDIAGHLSETPFMSSDGKTFYLSDWNDIYVSYYVPEPASILLLCIGGLLIRKR